MGIPSESRPSDLSTFLARFKPVAQEEVVWGGKTHLLASCYIGSDVPPPEYITSVRSVVLRGGEVLVLRNPDETHIMPGGRREKGETLQETLRREVLEETGWEMEPVAVLGFIHFHHLTPQPSSYLYPYPDFIHLLYLSLATEERLDARIPDDYEQESAFHSILEITGAGAGDASIDANQMLYLQAATAIMARKGTRE